MSEHATTFLRRLSLAAVVVLTGCASGPATISAQDPSGGDVPPTSNPSTSAAVAQPGETWVAVLDTASDPGRLNSPRKDVLHELGDVLEGSVVISPGACLEGLPEELGAGYVLAIQRDSQQDVRALVSLLSREPLFTGDVTIMCSD